MKELFERYPALKICKDDIEKATQLLIATYKNKGKVLVCGNGGSAADSEHIVGELMKGFLKHRPVDDERIPKELRSGLQGALPAISLVSQSSILTAYSNDADPKMSFAQLTYGYGQKGDLLIGISTSGNSENVIAAVEVANAVGMNTLCLTGEKESKLSAISNVCIKAPATDTYKIQEYHLPIYHYLCKETEKEFFKC